LHGSLFSHEDGGSSSFDVSVNFCQTAQKIILFIIIAVRTSNPTVLKWILKKKDGRM
jgi:hypothetical protein